MTVGDRIKKKRKLIGMAQIELAEKIKISKQTLYKYENNIVTNIPSDKIEDIANCLEVSPAYLMGWEKPSVDDAEMIADMIGDRKLMKYMSIVKDMDKEDKEKVYSYIDFINIKK